MSVGTNNSGAKEVGGAVHEVAVESWLKARHDAVSPRPIGQAKARIQKEGEVYTNTNALASPINPQTTRKNNIDRRASRPPGPEPRERESEPSCATEQSCMQ